MEVRFAKCFSSVALSCHQSCLTAAAAWQQPAHNLQRGQDGMRLPAPALFGGVSDASNWLSTSLSYVLLRAEYYYDTGDSRIPPSPPTCDTFAALPRGMTYSYLSSATSVYANQLPTGGFWIIIVFMDALMHSHRMSAISFVFATGMCMGIPCATLPAHRIAGLIFAAIFVIEYRSTALPKDESDAHWSGKVLHSGQCCSAAFSHAGSQARCPAVQR